MSLVPLALCHRQALLDGRVSEEVQHYSGMQKIPLIKITSEKYFDYTRLFGSRLANGWLMLSTFLWCGHMEKSDTELSQSVFRSHTGKLKLWSGCSQHCCLVDAHRLRKSVLVSGSYVDKLIHLQSWQIAVNEFLGPSWGRKFIYKEGLLDLPVAVEVPWCVSSPACYCAEGLFCCFGAVPGPCADLWWLL